MSDSCAARWLVALLLAACNGGSNATDAGPPDGAVDLTPDATPVAPVREPTPLPIKQWIAAAATSSTASAVRQALEQDTFDLPAPGKAHGLDWTPLTPGKDGEISSMLPAGTLLVAATQFDVPASRHVFGRFDSIADLRTNGVLQPGDVYAAHRVRIPLSTRSKDNLLVVQGYARGSSRPQVELWTTEDELLLNLADATLPDLVVGDSSELWLGIPVLNLTDKPVLDVNAAVEQSAHFAATAVVHPSLAPGAVTALAFRLTPKQAVATAGQKATVVLRVQSSTLAWTYRRELALTAVAAGDTYRRTFRSTMDGSAQYYGVVPPSNFDPNKQYALVLSLHGAGVEAINQATSYSPKDWAYIVAATNRRPYGFDWEEFGRVDAMEVLDHATASFNIARERVCLTGHSMGGHGTYHMGVHFPGRFAAIAPSAGWGSFETYTGAVPPTGALGRARAASNTLDYLGNLAKRGAFVLQGEKDTNVPASQAQMMVGELKKVTSDVVYHEEPGMSHWWDGSVAQGVDCVDWPALFDFLKAHTLEPTELDFKFTTPSPWVNDTHAYVKLQSEADPGQDCVVESTSSGSTVTLVTSNVRSMSIDGAALAARGVSQIVIDGKQQQVTGKTFTVGPQNGKRTGLHGPLNQAFQRPFCLVYPDDGPAAYGRYASYLVSTWAVLGNGLACALPLSRVTAATRASHNLIYLGVPQAGLKVPSGVGWDTAAITVGGTAYNTSALALVFVEGDHLAAAFTATSGAEYLLFRYHPFGSRSGLPDYFVFSPAQATLAGFFSSDWTYQP